MSDHSTATFNQSSSQDTEVDITRMALKRFCRKIAAGGKDFTQKVLTSYNSTAAQKEIAKLHESHLRHHLEEEKYLKKVRTIAEAIVLSPPLESLFDSLFASTEVSEKERSAVQKGESLELVAALIGRSLNCVDCWEGLRYKMPKVKCLGGEVWPAATTMILTTPTIGSVEKSE